MKKIGLMVFDFDGTLVSSGDDIATSVNHTLLTMGLPLRSREEIIAFIGDGVRTLLGRSLGDNQVGRIDEALGVFREHYAAHLLDTTLLYPGTLDVLNHFGDTKKVVITNKRYEYTIKIAESLGIDGYFKEIIGMDSSSFRKPDERLLVPLLGKYGVRNTETVVVGDGINDILLAKNGGALSYALLNGLGNRVDLMALDPDYCCEDIDQMKELFI